MPPPLLTVLSTGRVSTITRRVLESRLAITDDYQPAFFTREQFHLLQIVINAVLPQRVESAQIPIAAQIDMRLAKDEGDGWRYAALPADPESYRRALRIIEESLAPASTAARDQLPASAVSALLLAIQGKEHDTDDFPVSRWFEGFKVDVIRYWLADPRTMELIGYDGFADQDATPQPASTGGQR